MELVDPNIINIINWSLFCIKNDLRWLSHILSHTNIQWLRIRWIHRKFHHTRSDLKSIQKKENLNAIKKRQKKKKLSVRNNFFALRQLRQWEQNDPSGFTVTGGLRAESSEVSTFEKLRWLLGCESRHKMLPFPVRSLLLKAGSYTGRVLIHWLAVYFYFGRFGSLINSILVKECICQLRVDGPKVAVEKDIHLLISVTSY